MTPDRRRTELAVPTLRRLAGAAVVVVATFVTVLGVTAAPAQAHAVLVDSTPEDGSSLPSAPAVVRLRFDENVQLVAGTARVLSDEGSDVGAGAARGSGATVTIPLRPAAPRGQYTATWRVISADGHVVSGSIHFGIGEPAGHESAPGPTGGSAVVDVAYDLGTGLGAILLVVVIGVPIGLWVTGQRRPGAALAGTPRFLVVGATGLAVAAAGLALVADQDRVRGVGLWSSASWRLDRWDLGSHTDLMLLVRVLSLVVLLGVTLRPGRGGRTAGRVAAVVLLASHAWVGHAAVGSWVWVAVLSTGLHLAAMTLWLGGLLALLLALVGRAGGPPDRVPVAWSRWSRVATGCVLVLVLTGTVQALRQVRPLASLTDTRYGVLLLVKVALVGLVLVVAAGSRRALGSLLGSDPASGSVARSQLLARVGTELGCLVLVLAVTTVLVTEPPARETYGPAVTLTAPLAADHLRVAVAGTRRGPQTITVTRESATGRRLPLQALSGTLSLPTGDVAAIDVVFEATRDGSWQSTGAVAPLPGRWQLDLDAGIDQATAYATLVRYRVW